MKIEDHSIILAPGSLHLALYEEIYAQKGSCLDINVMTPEAYILSLLETPKEQTLPVLYAYRDLLQDLPEDNVFYESRLDYAFLSACYEWCGWMQLFDLQNLPDKTQKDQDMKEILSRLMTIPLWQQEAGQLNFADASRIWILDSQYPEQTSVLMARMIEQGAHLFGKPADKQKLEYWAASNPRKEMELAADEIILKEYAAEDVFIALANSVDTRVIDQVFNNRGIPHTFLHDLAPSKILRQFQSIFAYILEPSQDKLQDILKELFYRQSADLRQYLTLFPKGSSLKELVYEDNPMISEQEFHRLQSLEAQSEPWLPELTRIKNWTFKDMEDIATLIQEQNPNPAEEDIKMFDNIISAYASVQKQLNSNEDLQLFVHHLNHLHPSSTLHSMSGVLIGAPKEISSLRPIVFYIGADATHYPGFAMHSGIFDEEYLAKTEFPSLQSRLEAQKKNLEQRLQSVETLYILTPQSNYEGDPIDTSFEMNTWTGRLPAFMRVDDPSIWISPDFSLSENAGTQMFAPHNVFQAGVRSLQTFQDCPLKHMLQFGMHLRKERGFFEDLSVRPEVVHKLLFDAKMELGKSYEELTKEDVSLLIERELSFPRKVFADSQNVLDVLQKENTEKLWNLLQSLKHVNSFWNLSMTAQDFSVNLNENINDLNVEITGSLTPASKAAFSLYDPAQLAENPLASPKASLALGLQAKPVEAAAYRLSYGRGSSSASVHPIAKDQNETAYMTEFLKNSVTAHNLEDVSTGYADVIKKKIPTYEQKQADLKSAAQSFVLSLSSGCISPEHKAGACKYCAYRSICRNGAVEKG